jgi:hypothetical protein
MHVLFMLFVFTYAYWCPTRFPYHMMFMSFNVTQQVSLVEHGTPNTLRNTQDHSRFLVRLVLLNV